MQVVLRINLFHSYLVFMNCCQKNSSVKEVSLALELAGMNFEDLDWGTKKYLSLRFDLTQILIIHIAWIGN